MKPEGKPTTRKDYARERETTIANRIRREEGEGLLGTIICE